MRQLFVSACALLLSAGSAHAHEGFSFGGPNGHAPIGVMGDHVHEQGELMLSYRYMYMHMDGNQVGSDDISASEIVDPGGEGFVVSPTQMDTEMHMFGAMYAINDRVTLMGMLPYVIKEMDHLTRSGARFTTRSEGIGDFMASALVRVLNNATQSLHLNLGLSLPFGSISESDDNPRCRMLDNCPAQLPYPMQIGSGTFDPTIGATWWQQQTGWNWGAQAKATFRLGRNDKGYSKGELFQATTWAATQLSSTFSVSARLAARDMGNYDGEDEDLAVSNTGFITTAETNLRGGTRAEAGLGLNWSPSGALSGHRLALEFLAPFYQDLDGPQLESDGMLLLGWQFTRY